MRKLLLISCLCVAACGGGTSSPPPSPAPQPQPPSFTSAASASVPENSAAGSVVYSATASDPNGDPVRFSIVGGADAALFAITPSGGLSFNIAPDFEAPADADRNNRYEVILQASDGTLSTQQSLTITVTDQPDGSANAIRLRKVASGLVNVREVAPIAGDPRLLVLLDSGDIHLLDPRSGTTSLYLSVPASTTAQLSQANSVVAAPDFATSGTIYIARSTTVAPNDAVGFDLVRYTRGSSGAADPASADIIMRARDVNTGAISYSTVSSSADLAFGPDGMLHVLTGDASRWNDVFRVYQSRAGDLSSFFGKVLRIDVRGDAFPADPNRDYSVPANNPPAGGLPELFVFGLRDPRHPVFEDVRLYFGDQGWNVTRRGSIPAIEVNLLTPTQVNRDYGWPKCEGLRTGPFTSQGCTGTVPPIVTYDGFEAIPFPGGSYLGNQTTLRSTFIVAQPGSSATSPGTFWTIPTTDLQTGTVTAPALVDRKADLLPDTGTIAIIGGLGRDSAGKIYLFDADADGEIFLII